MTPPNVTMVAPSTVTPGSHGSSSPMDRSTNVSAAGTVSVPVIFLSTMLDAGYDLSPASGLPLTSGHVLVGDSSNQAADVAMSGDATMDNTGATVRSRRPSSPPQRTRYIRTDVGTKDICSQPQRPRER
jgi:hypothetical protein